MCILFFLDIEFKYDFVQVLTNRPIFGKFYICYLYCCFQFKSFDVESKYDYVQVLTNRPVCAKFYICYLYCGFQFKSFDIESKYDYVQMLTNRQNSIYVICTVVFSSSRLTLNPSMTMCRC